MAVTFLSQSRSLCPSAGRWFAEAVSAPTGTLVVWSILRSCALAQRLTRTIERTAELVRSAVPQVPHQTRAAVLDIMLKMAMHTEGGGLDLTENSVVSSKRSPLLDRAISDPATVRSTLRCSASTTRASGLFAVQDEDGKSQSGKVRGAMHVRQDRCHQPREVVQGIPWPASAPAGRAGQHSMG